MKIVILIVNKSEILQKSMLNIQGPPKVTAYSPYFRNESEF